ncbi:hypothetical protein JCM10212_005622 [Sporobolomyces blumeae]
MDILELVHEDRSSSSSRPFTCTYPECNKGFARKSDLVRHERIHTNERPWQCEWPGCERDFIQRSALIVHMRTHTGERPHRCEYAGCSKAFSDSSSLARHRRIHTGKRPYQCAVRSCLKTFCRKTTLTKHIKKNHPQHSHAPDAVSLASFGDKTPQLGYTPSVDSSAPQTPSDVDAGLSDDDEGGCELPTPPVQYSYFPPDAHHQIEYPETPATRSRARLHPPPHYLGQQDASSGAWSAPGYIEGYPDVSAPPMHRTVSHESQAYLTPPPTHQTRFRSSRRKAARGRYREYDEDDEELGRDDDDDDYVEGRELKVAPKARRGAVAVAPSPASLEPPSAGNRVARKLVYATPSPSEDSKPRFTFSPLPPQDPQFVPLPEEFVSPPTPISHSTSYPMQLSYTAPMPSTYAFESTVSSSSNLSPGMHFAAPPLRRTSSYSTLESAAYPPPLPPPPSMPRWSNGSPALSHVQPSGMGLGLSLGPPFGAGLHERLLSDIHHARSAEPTYGYDDFSFDEPPPLPPSSLASPTAHAFMFPPRPASAQERRGSIGFPSLPPHLTLPHASDFAPPSSSLSSSGMASTFAPPPDDAWMHHHHHHHHRPSFSSMTTRLLDRLDHEDAAAHASGMVMASY